MDINNFLRAKKRADGPVYKWLPLNQHLLDTRNVGAILWDNWLSQGQKLRISEDLSVFDFEDSKKVFMFLCQIHDLGKATYNFQTTKNWNSTEELESILREKLHRAGFKDTDRELACPRKSPHALEGEIILRKAGFGPDIASIIGAHHGKPAQSNELSKQVSYLSNYYGSEDPSDPDYILWQKAQRELIARGLRDNGFKSPEDLPHLGKASQIILSALLIMADWLASNEEYFPLIGLDENSVANPDERAFIAYEKWEKSDLWEPSSIEDIENETDKDIFELRFGFSPRDEQVIFKKIIEACEEPGIFIYEAPMGSGKTEAALVGVEELAYKTSRSGMFFGLPSQASSNAIFPRIEKWLEKVDGDRHSIRLSHGKAALNYDFSSLASNVNIDENTGKKNEKKENQTVVVNERFAGRKTSSLDDFVIGTVDQFLLMSLKQKHLALRHLGFDKKVVVIDEVHAYDVYMDQYLKESIRRLGYYGVPVILLSATLPADKREAMVDAYLKGRGIKTKEITSSLNNLKKDPYPLITYTDGDEIHQYEDFPIRQRKNIAISKIYNEDLLGLIKDLAKDEGIIGIVVNTVKKAQSLAKECVEVFGEERIELIHSGFIAIERAKKEVQLLGMIGKKGNRPKSKIIIGTQVIEQSLDIDFDVLITDLAPMDLMIQRIGRLHRHDRDDRSEAYKDPRVYVSGLNEDFEFDPGSLAVYGGYILARSQYYLPEKLTIPDDISRLVQEVYSDEDLDIDNKKRYEDYKEEKENLREKKEAKAKTFLLQQIICKTQKKHNKETMDDWLNEDAILETEEKARAQVRDSDDSIEVIALKKRGAGFGIFGEDKDLSKSISNPNIGRLIAQSTLKIPRAFTYEIDKIIEALEDYNRVYLRDFQDQAWLKGSLGIIFDENNEFIITSDKLNKIYKLKYEEKYGLSYEIIKKE